MNINNELSLSLSAEYDLIVDKGRTLDAIINCTFEASGVTYPFLMSGYTAATLTVKNQSGTVLMTFNTSDGSIVIGTSSIRLLKSAEEMNVVRAGEYAYDMYLVSAVRPKRGFWRGKITFINAISN